MAVLALALRQAELLKEILELIHLSGGHPLERQEHAHIAAFDFLLRRYVDHRRGEFLHQIGETAGHAGAERQRRCLRADEHQDKKGKEPSFHTHRLTHEEEPFFQIGRLAILFKVLQKIILRRKN